MNEQLGLCGKVEVDDDVEHWNVDATCCQVGHDENASQTLAELCDADLTRRRVKSTVRIRAPDVGFRQQLHSIRHVLSTITVQHASFSA